MKTLITCQQDTRGVARVTLNHPEKLNSLSVALMRQLIDTLNQLRSDDLRAVVITGAGGKAFICGANVDEMAGADATAAREFITLVHQCCDAVRRIPVPTIARIEGYTIGAGVEFAAACDMRVASNESVFSMPEVRLGIPSVVEAVLLPGLIGWGKTRRLLLTGESISAQEAMSWGLVEMAVEREKLDDVVEHLLNEILANAPKAVRLQKQLIDSWMERPMHESISASIDAFTQACTQHERGERMQAHIAARKAAKQAAKKSKD